MANLAADVRARSVNDLVTILVLDKASAVSKGTSRATRDSEAKASIEALGGSLSPTNRLRNLASLSGSTKLDGQGETTRENVLSTSLTARVTHVLPNGDLVVQGSKNVSTNSENQLVTIRGVVRALDLSQANTVASDRLGYLEVSVDGKGIVADAVRRPNFLYRMLLGILPF
jgi:flagellar L-ring protein precursor FlgH